MPIYEYVCEKCNSCFEHLTYSTSDAGPRCPKCKAKEVKKQMSAGCVRPKGLATGSGGFTPPACAPSGG